MRLLRRRALTELVAYLLVALIVAVPVGIWAWSKLGSVDRGAAIRANDRVLARLGRYPGSVQFARDDVALRDESLTPVHGYSTQVQYRLARRPAVRAVVAWFGRRLPGWREERFDGSDGATWRRDGSSVTVVVYAGRAPSYELFVEAS